MFTPPRMILNSLLPGDCLIYRPSGVFGWLTAVKTWCRCAGHVEGYCGDGVSVASRNGIGVNSYAVRLEGLSRVLRPVCASPDGDRFDFEDALGWFRATACGQKYDWKGLLCFTLAVRQGAADRMFCSEFLTRWYRAGGFQPFAREWDADEVAPATFLVPPPSVFKLVWSDEGKH